MDFVAGLMSVLEVLQILLILYQHHLINCMQTMLFVCLFLFFEPINSLILFNLNRLTHWKQDLLLIKEPLSLMKGDIIKGNIIMNRHKVWRRHMTLQLTFTVLRNDDVIYPVWL